MLFLELFLTVTAWGRGYKGSVLLPLIFAVGLVFLIVINSQGSVRADNFLDSIWIDILAVVALGIMIAVGVRKTEENPATGNFKISETKAGLPEH